MRQRARYHVAGANQVNVDHPGVGVVINRLEIRRHANAGTVNHYIRLYIPCGLCKHLPHLLRPGNIHRKRPHLLRPAQRRKLRHRLLRRLHIKQSHRCARAHITPRQLQPDTTGPAGNKNLSTHKTHTPLIELVIPVNLPTHPATNLGPTDTLRGSDPRYIWPHEMYWGSDPELVAFGENETNMILL